MSSLCWFIDSCCLQDTHKHLNNRLEQCSVYPDENINPLCKETFIQLEQNNSINKILFWYVAVSASAHIQALNGETAFGSDPYLTRFWKAYPSVHCSVNEAPCLTVVKCPKRRRSCMLFSLHACFSCVLWTLHTVHLLWNWTHSRAGKPNRMKPSESTGKYFNVCRVYMYANFQQQHCKYSGLKFSRVRILEPASILT